jgi:hypothetical protein
MERSMRVAVIVVAMLAVTTPSQASQSCMSKTEARNHFSSSHIYWHGPDHCWDATPSRHHRIYDVRREKPTREVERKADQGEPEPSKPDLKPERKWRDSMSEMLPEADQILRAPRDARNDAADAAAAGPTGSDSGANVASFPLASSTLASRWVDIVQVIPPIAEPKTEPSVAPSGVLLLFAAFVLVGGSMVLLLGVTLHQWPRSTISL